MYDQENIFAKIINGQIPCEEIYNDDKVLAFKDIAPAAPVHILVIPKGEYVSFNDFSQNADPDTIKHFMQTIQKIAKDQGLESDGYRLITNHGKNANQTVPHFHVHILGGKKNDRPFVK